MTVNRGLYVRNNGATGTTPTEARLIQAALVAENAPGTPRQGLLDQAVANVVTGTATMSYNVAACTPVINRAAGEGVYLMTLTGTTNVATTAAPGTGSRYDLIYVKQNDLDKGDANNLPVLGVVQGTSSTGTPTKPYASVPAGAYVLAEARIYSGTTGTTGGSNTMTQVWRYTSMRGVPIPVRNQAERDEITPSLGTEVRRLDSLNGRLIEWWNGTIWKLPPEALGLVAYAELGGNTGTINAQIVVLNIPTFTFRAGRRYRVGASGGGYSNTTAATYSFGINTCSTSDAANLTTGLTQLKSRSFRWDIAGEGREALNDATRNNLTYAADTTLQVKLTAGAVVGTGSLVLTSDATNRVMIFVEDLGEII